MKKQSLQFLLMLMLCIIVVLGACGSNNTDAGYNRRVLKGEIEQYMNSDYIVQTFWIDDNNCLFAFSQINTNNNDTENYRVYKYSITEDKLDLIFNNKLNGYLDRDNSFCQVIDDGFLLVIGNTILHFNNSYKYLEEKKVSINDGTFVCISKDGQKAAILSDDKLYYANVDDIDKKTKAFDRYYGYKGNICFNADGNLILQSVGTPETTTIIDVFDIQTQALSHLTCLDSLTEDDHVGVGLLYPYDETHIMLRINGAEFTNFHDTYVLVDYENDTCEVVHRSSDISEFQLDNASGTWELENSENLKLVINPFNESKITVELEETPSKYGSGVWINPKNYSFVYLDRRSEDEYQISIYSRK